MPPPGVEGAVGASAASTLQSKDFVATVDVTEGSPCFGQVISEAEVPTSGNEPHHVGLNQDGTVSMCQPLLHVIVTCTHGLPPLNQEHRCRYLPRARLAWRASAAAANGRTFRAQRPVAVCCALPWLLALPGLCQNRGGSTAC